MFSDGLNDLNSLNCLNRLREAIQAFFAVKSSEKRADFLLVVMVRYATHDKHIESQRP